ncbi:cilia- and flagella-associated protein 298 isoform X2 [Anastrepha obliqua]|uniref:cilia- and flagella-associated protein 298 isoform X2 n=1 Tax=Anastrepha obliqua TaxID=95512 RepID=UPI002409B0D7|nr:cilia- and flagella-associated protein 298 isoform X2 [Anastrepha obliqua]
MVLLQVKRGDENLFIYETNVGEGTTEIIRDITAIYNGRLKVYRICSEIEELIEHGTMLPPEMIGLTDEQILELKLSDIWSEKCVPAGGYVINKDPLGRRNGQRPQEKMREMLKKAMEDAKKIIEKKLVQARQPLNLKNVDEALNLLRGAITIVYPMQLPPHDIIRMEFTNTEDLSGTQASREVIESAKAQLWFAGKQVLPEKKLHEYIGMNDKTKVVVKINKHGEGPPSREAVLTEDIRKRMMAEAYRRQEELKQRCNT